MDRSPARLLLVLAALSVALQGCGTSSPLLHQTGAMHLYLDENEMKAEILRHIAVGSPIEEAKRVMETNGFTCKYERDLFGELHAHADPARRGEVYLICSKYTPQSSWITSDQIKVFISFSDHKVQDVRVDHIKSCL
jgi:hypothetical protein